MSSGLWRTYCFKKYRRQILPSARPSKASFPFSPFASPFSFRIIPKNHTEFPDLEENLFEVKIQHGSPFSIRHRLGERKELGKICHRDTSLNESSISLKSRQIKGRSRRCLHIATSAFHDSVIASSLTAVRENRNRELPALLESLAAFRGNRKSSPGSLSLCYLP